ncbi:MAG: type II toxin-antitoxin system RelE/ParE family toxin [Rhodospirillales bacterium]|nr:type II toxin-antitoxin system RelE/ParE family toxin [Rhodospirillales bacterium]MDE0713015.1 type II toxin-antitoxin system RelE/ParE family toxin [Rhodospirillales bacterium]
MRALRWLPEALDDLKRLHAFIEPHSPQAAARAIGVLLASAERLTSFPEMGRPWEADNDFRELPVRFGTRGYVIRYRLPEDRVVIVRVWHALEQR